MQAAAQTEANSGGTSVGYRRTGRKGIASLAHEVDGSTHPSISTSKAWKEGGANTLRRERRRASATKTPQQSNVS